MREGTRKSRAPSGEDAVRIGVLNSKKPCPSHAPAHRLDDLDARHDVLMQLLAAQIEEAVLQADVFGIFLLAEHRQRQVAGRAQNFDLADIDLDLAGRQIVIVGAFGATTGLAVHPYHEFRAQLFSLRERRRVRVDHALGQAVMVAQVDEQHAAMVANAMDPA
ncbi:hypothetical protein ACVWWP_005294 [Bradyrhizobium sp. LM3.6]